jgi:hypothetical protein
MVLLQDCFVNQNCYQVVAEWHVFTNLYKYLYPVFFEDILASAVLSIHISLEVLYIYMHAHTHTVG